MTCKIGRLHLCNDKGLLYCIHWSQCRRCQLEDKDPRKTVEDTASGKERFRDRQSIQALFRGLHKAEASGRGSAVDYETKRLFLEEHYDGIVSDIYRHVEKKMSEKVDKALTCHLKKQVVLLDEENGKLLTKIRKLREEIEKLQAREKDRALSWSDDEDDD